MVSYYNIHDIFGVNNNYSDFSIFVLDEEGNRIERKVHKIVIRQCPYFAAVSLLDNIPQKSKEGK